MRYTMSIAPISACHLASRPQSGTVARGQAGSHPPPEVGGEEVVQTLRGSRAAPSIPCASWPWWHGSMRVFCSQTSCQCWSPELQLVSQVRGSWLFDDHTKAPSCSQAKSTFDQLFPVPSQHQTAVNRGTAAKGSAEHYNGLSTSSVPQAETLLITVCWEPCSSSAAGLWAIDTPSVQYERLVSEESCLWSMQLVACVCMHDQLHRGHQRRDLVDINKILMAGHLQIRPWADGPLTNRHQCRAYRACALACMDSLARHQPNAACWSQHTH